jgi:hypothetical protein
MSTLFSGNIIFQPHWETIGPDNLTMVFAWIWALLVRPCDAYQTLTLISILCMLILKYCTESIMWYGDAYWLLTWCISDFLYIYSILYIVGKKWCLGVITTAKWNCSPSWTCISFVSNIIDCCLSGVIEDLWNLTLVILLCDTVQGTDGEQKDFQKLPDS